MQQMDPDRWRVAGKPAAKKLFGRPTRVLLAAWILNREGRPFYLKEAQRALDEFGEAGSAVSKELAVFVGHDMLKRTADEQRVWFTVADHPMWRAFGAIVGALELGDGWSRQDIPPPRQTKAPRARPSRRR